VFVIGGDGVVVCRGVGGSGLCCCVRDWYVFLLILLLLVVEDGCFRVW
jgi:hypothetical protein